MNQDAWPPTEAALRERLAAVDAAAYARSRNALDGAATGLSPYLSHGFVTPLQVLQAVAAGGQPLHLQHRLVQELGWREYFRHVWVRLGDGIFQWIHRGPLADAEYAAEMPADIREGRTGVPVVDRAGTALDAPWDALESLARRPGAVLAKEAGAAVAAGVPQPALVRASRRGLPGLARCRPAPRLFPEPRSRCNSFSQWWKAVTRELSGCAPSPSGIHLAESF